MATYLVTINSSGCSATNLARKIGVTRKTAHYMLLKLSANLGFENNYLTYSEFDRNIEKYTILEKNSKQVSLKYSMLLK